MNKKITKKQVNKTAVDTKATVWLIQYHLKKNENLDTLLNYVNALRLMTNKLENELKLFKGAN